MKLVTPRTRKTKLDQGARDLETQSWVNTCEGYLSRSDTKPMTSSREVGRTGAQFARLPYKEIRRNRCICWRICGGFRYVSCRVSEASIGIGRKVSQFSLNWPCVIGSLSPSDLFLRLLELCDHMQCGEHWNRTVSKMKT